MLNYIKCYIFTVKKVDWSPETEKIESNATIFNGIPPRKGVSFRFLVNKATRRSLDSHDRINNVYF